MTTSLLNQWRLRITALLNTIDSDESTSIAAAAAAIAASLRRGGVVQTFATGHSRSVALEFAGRAGGLVATNQLGIRDLAYYGQTPLQSLIDPKLEREHGLARQILDLATIDPADIFIIISNSGRNAAIVEMAKEITSRGHQIIAITSCRTDGDPEMENYLAALADFVIDTHGDDGDASLETPAGRACGTSTLAGIYIVQALTAATIEYILAAGDNVDLLVSANWPGGDEANAARLATFGTRVRLGDA